MAYVKLWDNILDNIKVHRLPDDLYRVWINILAVTARYGGGVSEAVPVPGELPTWDDMEFGLRTNRATIETWITRLVTAGFIDRTDRHYSLHDFEKWNQPKDKSSAKRQAEWRKRNALRNAQRNGVSETLHNDPPGKEGIKELRKLRKAAGIRAHAHADPEAPACEETAAAETEPPPTADFSSHQEENAADWREALNVLRARADTAALADLIEASRDPRIPALDGWRTLVASYAMQKPGKKIVKTVGAWIRCAEVANAGDLEAIEHPRGKPEPGVNGAMTNGMPAPTPTPSQRIKAEAGARPPPDPTELRARLAELESLRRPNPLEAAEAASIREELAKLDSHNP